MTYDAIFSVCQIDFVCWRIFWIFLKIPNCKYTHNSTPLDYWSVVNPFFGLRFTIISYYEIEYCISTIFRLSTFILCLVDGAWARCIVMVGLSGSMSEYVCVCAFPFTSTFNVRRPRMIFYRFYFRLGKYSHTYYILIPLFLRENNKTHIILRALENALCKIICSRISNTCDMQNAK